MATMGRYVYLLRFMLSRRSNGGKQIFNFSGLSLSRRSNSEELTRFRTAADTVFSKQTFFMQSYAAKKMCCSLKHTHLIAICFLTLCALRNCWHVTRRNKQNLEKKKKKRVLRDSHVCVPTYNGNSEHFL